MDFDDGGNPEQEGDHGIRSVACEYEVVALQFEFEDGDEVGGALEEVSEDVGYIFIFAEGLVGDGGELQVVEVVESLVDVGDIGSGEVLPEYAGQKCEVDVRGLAGEGAGVAQGLEEAGFLGVREGGGGSQFEFTGI